MRINPFLIPLMAVLATPFAAGIAHTSTLNPMAPVKYQTVGGQTLCANCTAGGTLQKIQDVPDMGCSYYSQGEYPYIQQTGVCTRYTCANGYYYSWSGWSNTTTCTQNPLTATPCPTGSCTNPN